MPRFWLRPWILCRAALTVFLFLGIYGALFTSVHRLEQMLHFNEVVMLFPKEFRCFLKVNFDKFAHFAGALCLTYLFVGSFKANWIKLKLNITAYSLLFIIGLSYAIEILQAYFAPGREFSHADVLSAVLGSILAIAFWALFRVLGAQKNKI